MKPISCNQEMGDTGRLLCPGVPQGPAQFHVLCGNSPLPLSVRGSGWTLPTTWLWEWAYD